MNDKSCSCCKHWETCSADRGRRCRVWDNYNRRVVDLLLWEGEYDDD
jgi:hypothetical protein